MLALAALVALAACSEPKKAPERLVEPTPPLALAPATATAAASTSTAAATAAPNAPPARPPSPEPVETASPSPTPSPTPSPAPKPLVPDQPPPSTVQAGTWAMVNTPGGCLKVRVSFEPESLAIDCLPNKMLVFVDGTQMYNGDLVAHLTGRGYVYSYGLAVTQNPAESIVPFDQRPAQLGRVAFTAPDGNVWVLAANGANPAQITGTGSQKDISSYYSSLAWSPDGSVLLLRRDSDTGHDVQVYGAGSGLRTLYPPRGVIAPVNPGVAAWSSDSGHVLVTDYAESGDACSRPTNQLAVRSVDVGTGAVTELYHGQRNGFVHSLVASPDGRTVALLFGASCDAVTFDLCLLSLQPEPQYNVQAGDLAALPARRRATSPGRRTATCSRSRAGCRGVATNPRSRPGCLWRSWTQEAPRTIPSPGRCATTATSSAWSG